MITRTDAAVQILPSNKLETPAWQQQLRAAVTTLDALLEELALTPSALPFSDLACRQFPLRVPRPYIAKMKKGDPLDPLLLQILPSTEELRSPPGFSLDPLAEAQSNQQQGIIHKYHGRLLLIVSGGCAINCRYCFRRHFPYQDNQLSGEHWQRMLDYIAADSSLNEVILSGGDPLASTDARLARLVEDLAAIPHLQRLRIHTRLPVAIPERITDELVSVLSGSRLTPLLVTHCNHAQEIDRPFRQAMARLRTAGITLLNQAVFLRRINDSVDALKALSEALFDAGILPYYLHLLDPVQGAAGFDLPEQRAQRAIGELMGQLPGYLVPKLVRERAGQPAKTPIMPLLPDTP